MTKRELAQSKIRTYRENPVQFVYEEFGVDPDEWQRDALESIGGPYNPERRLAMKACTGPGKTATLAWAGWHRLLCFATHNEHPKGAALSITNDNLKDNLWPELAKWQGRSELLKSQFTWTKEKIYANQFPETWFLSARSFAKDADTEAIGRALSGLHSKFPFLLLDEMGDMPVAVGRSAEQIFTGGPKDALVAGAGNPTSTDGLLYLICNKLRNQWRVITITADPDDPKRTPRVSVELARKQIEEYGRDNPWIMATILGLFPPAGFNQLLGIEDVEAAMQRHYTPEQYNFAAKILGLDVARQGDDRSILFPRQGLVAFQPQIFRNVTGYALAGHCAKKEENWQADGVLIDETGGWGAAVVDAYEVMGRQCIGVQFAAKAYDERYANKRAEMWFLMAEWVKGGGALPYIPELIQELTAPTYTFKGDKFLLEPKDKIKERIGRSPDLADGLALTFAEPVQKRDMLEQMLVRMAPEQNEDWHPFSDMP